ncbi:MAG TPA: peptidase [Lachnospiraceae bacterium]|nr:peptidase [Lachnospiraceae bacterium]
MYFNFQYLYVLFPAMILAMYAQSKVKSTFNKYSRVGNSYGLTGAEVAERLLRIAGINDVSVERIGGNLTDHYDPGHKVLRLSESVYSSQSLAAIGVAAHETGHAVQHATGYAALGIRSALVPVTNIGSKLSMPMIFIGVLLGSQAGSDMGYMLVQLGIAFFSLAVVFALVTLPVELNASARAVEMLDANGILNSSELAPVKKVLSAAALTYVASAAVAIAQLLRLLLLFGRRRD